MRVKFCQRQLCSDTYFALYVIKAGFKNAHEAALPILCGIGRATYLFSLVSDRSCIVTSVYRSKAFIATCHRFNCRSRLTLNASPKIRSLTCEDKRASSDFAFALEVIRPMANVMIISCFLNSIVFSFLLTFEADEAFFTHSRLWLLQMLDWSKDL